MRAKTKELKVLLKYYEDNLCDKTFKYQLKNNIIIDVIFYRENLCHLLGLQHVFYKDRKYLGLAGFEKIKNETLTIDSLKKHNMKKYDGIDLKLSHFDSIFKLLNKGEMLKFYQHRSKPNTSIVADFIIYDDEIEYILHLFLKKENDNTNQYAPVSFVVKSSRDKSYNQFVTGQEYKKITYFKIINNK